MDEPLQQDPWEVLGLPKTATQAEIRGGWKKWALKNHPDKFTDPVEKKAKETVFHGGQLAYETLTDPEKLQEYESSVRIHEMRQEVLAKQARAGGNASRPSEATGPYRTRECTPNFATGPPPKTQERHSSYEDEEFYNKPKKSSSKSQYERPSARTEKVSSRAATDKKRAEQKKYHDKAKKSDRYEAYERNKLDSSDSDGYAKAQRTRREEEYSTAKKTADQLREAQETIRRDSASDRRKAEKSRDARDRDFSRERDRDSRHNVYTREYSRTDNDRPSPRRSTSSTYDTRGEKTATARRSHAATKPRAYDIVEEPESYDNTTYETRKPEYRKPSMPNATSSPAALHIPQESTRRSYSTQHYTSSHEPAPKPSMHRAETMPMPAEYTSSSRRRDIPSSKLREEDSGYSSVSNPPTPEMSYNPSGYTRSHQPSSTMPNVRHVVPDPQYVLREPVTSSYRYTSSPKRMSSERERSPKTSSRSTYPTPQYQTAVPSAKTTQYAYPDKATTRPSVVHAASSHSTARVGDEYPPRDRERERERGRGRDRPLYGEMDSPFHQKARRPDTERKNSFRPDEINWSRQYSEADVRYGRTKDDEKAEIYRQAFEDAKRELLKEQTHMASGGQDKYDPMPGLYRRGTAPVPTR